MMRKDITLIVMLLFVGMMINPSSGNILSLDDTTPPVTTYSLNPPDPDGDNGWYVSNVTVTVNATDDLSGVKEIRYRIDEGSWNIIHGKIGKFIVDIEGDDILIEYYAIDYAENEESVKSFTLDIDKKPPIDIQVEIEIYKEGGFYYLEISIKGKDATSLMNRVEFYINDGLQEIIEGRGPDYVFTIQWSEEFSNIIFWIILYDDAGHRIGVKIEFKKVFLFGRIENLTINDIMITFNAIWVFVIERSPFDYYLYASGEKIYIFRPRLEIITSKLLSGFFIMIRVSIHTNPPFP